MNAHRLDRRLVLRGLTAVGVAGALTALHDPSTGHADKERPAAILGTWLETTTTTDNSIPPFQVLFTYGAGGGMTATASLDLTPATLSGPTHGAWTQSEERSYRFLAHAFAFDPQGNPAGVYTIRESLTLDDKGESYRGSGSFAVDFNGQVTFSGAFTSAGKRVTV